MSAINYDTDWPTILSSSDTRLLEYERVQEIESENKFLTAGLFFMFIAATILVVHLNQKEQTKENASSRFPEYDY